MKAKKFVVALTCLSCSYLLMSGCAGLVGSGGTQHFIYSNDTAGNGQIFIYDVDSSTSTLVASNAFVGDLRFDGQKVVFAGGAGDTQIFTCNPDGSGQVQLTTLGTINSRPIWSHDGTRIAFYSNRDGNSEIYIMNADGSGQTRLTNDAGFDAQASFSPDDSKILWHSNRDGDYEIFTMNPDGTGVQQKTVNAVDDYCAAWLPDGSGFVYASTSTGGGDLYKYDIGTSSASLVYGTANSEAFPTVSPDQSKVYFAQRIAGTDRLCVVNMDGTNFQVLVDPADPKSAYINTGTAIVKY